MKKEKIEVEISNIDVTDRYYSFNYKVFRNDKLVKEDYYENDHSWADDLKGWKKTLKDGHALGIVLTNYGEDI